MLGSLFVTSIIPASVQAGFFGVGVYLSGEPDGDRATIATMMDDLGISITRHSFVYSGSVDFGPHDDAVSKTRAKNIELLGLLEYNGSRPSLGEWTTFVESVVERYRDDFVAWEIFNEEDNSISGSDYKPYLEASYNAIKARNGSAKVIVGGLTARSEAVSFWNSLYDAGGGSFFDALGLHPYRSDAPELVKFNEGDFVSSINLAASAIRSHGGGKKIWLTEFGLQSGQVGEDKQANYLMRSFLLARTVSEVEKIIMYRFRDNGGESFGLVGSGLSKKTAYNRYKDLLPGLDSSGTPTRIYSYDKKVLDGFDAGISGWKTNESSNTDLSLASTSGYSGQGMSYGFSFHQSSAYALANKPIAIPGEPTAIGIWAKGPGSTNVLKLRVVDANDETFQFDLGKVTDDWQFFRFGFATDTAKTSWNGNGVINFPITFDSIVYDHQGSSTSGTLSLDELVALYGSSDLFAYTFGSTLAYWRMSGGSVAATACGKNLTFTETPQTVSASGCSSWDSGTGGGASSGSSGGSSSSSGSGSTSAPPAELKKLAKDKSSVSLDKTQATADGNDTILATIKLRTAADAVLKSSHLIVEVSGSDNTVSEITFVKDHYEAKISSTKAQEKTITVKLGSFAFDLLKATFGAGPLVLDKTELKFDPAPPFVLGKAIQVQVVGQDAHTNGVSVDIWQLTSVPSGGITIAALTGDQKDRTNLTIAQPGRYLLSLTMGDQVVPHQFVVYGFGKQPAFADLPEEARQTIAFDAQTPLALTGKPGETRGITLTGVEAEDVDHLIFQVNSEPIYFWLAKIEKGIYQGVVTFPKESGAHEVSVYREDSAGTQTVVMKGALILAGQAVVATRSAVGGGLAAVAALVLASLVIWYRRRLFQKFKLGKYEVGVNNPKLPSKD